MQLLDSETLFTLLWCFSLVVSSPLVVHEKRDVPLRGNLERRRIERDVILPMRIGLKHNQHAAQNAERWLMDVSHPDSANYGRHWTQEEVIEKFQPSIETIRNVTYWLQEHGISEFTHSDNKLWFAFDTSVDRAESMLRTEYLEHYTGEGEVKASCDYYHLPAHLQDHVDYITPGVQPSDITDRTVQLRKRTSSPSRHDRKRATSSSVLPALTSGPPFSSTTSLAHCWKEVTPACIRALYNFSMADPSQPVSSKNAMGIFESARDICKNGHKIYQTEKIFDSPATDSQIDLDLFFETFEPDIPTGTSPFYYNIDGLKRPFTLKNATYGGYRGPGLESDADIEVALPIIYPQNVSVFDVLHDFGVKNNFFNRFFDAIDGSYCSSAQRGNSSQGGRPKCGVLKPTNVLSISYGVSETDFTAYWQERQCNEYLKLGLQGTSVFVASGDRGVDSLAYYNPNSGDVCVHANATGGPRVFLPSFPPACPWITTVGATQINPGNAVDEPEVAAQFWVPYNGRIVLLGSSGGGFSLNFKAPEYQKNALAYYFKNFHPPWPAFRNGSYENNAGRYNRNGRGYPDVSANGVHTATIFRLGYYSFSGTSSATPTVAALFNRIIEERIRAGKGPLGFVNPALYKHPEGFNDIIQGGNGFCYLDQGFTAVPGWDPVTGLGTPDYGKLLEIFMNLP